MRMFDKQIFMGNGNYSAGDCYEMICQVQTCIALISGMQQPMMSTDEYDPEQYKEEQADLQQELEWHVKSIVKGLLGENARVVIDKDVKDNSNE